MGRLLPAVGRLKGPASSAVSLNKITVFREVHGMLCEPLVVVKKTADVVQKTATGLKHQAYLTPFQKWSRTSIIDQVATLLTKASEDYTVRKGCYLVGECGYAIDAAIYLRKNLVAFLDIDMYQHYTRGALPTAALDGYNPGKNIIVVYPNEALPQRKSVFTECTHENLCRFLQLRDRIHARHFRDGTVPIIRSQPMLLNRSIGRVKMDLLCERIVTKIIELEITAEKAKTKS